MMHDRDDRRLVASFALLCGLIAPLVLYTVDASLPYNALELPLVGRQAARTLVPEGWKFFTRDATEPRLHPRRRDFTGAWLSADLGANAEAHHWFGLRRTSRVQPIELGALVANVDESQWRDCKVSTDICLEAAPTAATIVNVHPLRSLCGDIGLVLQQPVPWAWARRLGHVTMPARVLRLDVIC